MTQVFRRLRYLLNRRRLDKELQSDMEVHREMAALSGAPSFGNTLRLREEARDAWGWVWIDRLFQDLRYASRTISKSPGFTLVAVLILAIGIGVNVAAFGFFNLMVFRPLDVRDPATLLRFHIRSPQAYSYVLPWPEVEFFRTHSRTLSAVLALNSSTRLAMPGEEKPVNAHFVTANFFSELGAVPFMGRLLDESGDGTPASAPGVVLSHSFWQRHFAGDLSVIGTTIRLNGKPATVVGVAARQFSALSLDAPDLWAPMQQQPYFANGSRLLTDYSSEGSGVVMWGRLRPGISPRIAEQELKSLAAELHRQHPAGIWENQTLPGEPGGYATSLMLGGRRGTGREDKSELATISVLIASLSILILAVACTNLGSLLLARGVAREREIAIRVSVGAGRGRLVRQLFTESLLLAFMGAVAGMALGNVVLRTLIAVTGGPVWLNATPDWRVAGFAACTGVVAAVLFGLTPALQIARQRHRAGAMRQILVGAQVAASCVLLIVAGLLVRALHNAQSGNPGFEYQRVVSIEPNLSAHGYSPALARSYFETLQTRMRALPGVESTALSDTAPLGNRVAAQGMEVDGRSVEVLLTRADPGFFRTMGIPFLMGRNLRRGDAHAVVVGKSLALRLWPGKEPLGQKFNDDTVVGVVGSARLVRLEDTDMAEAYFPTIDADIPSLVLLVKTKGAPQLLARSAAEIAGSIDPNVFPQVQLLNSSFERKLKSAQTGAAAVSALGFAANLLACLGIFGVAAYAVSQRTKEIGIRMALGARSSHVIYSVIRQFSWPIVIGLLTGAAGAATLSGLLRRQLYGISNLDPIAYVGAIALFIVTTLIAIILPARRALHTDPLNSLRHQ